MPGKQLHEYFRQRRAGVLLHFTSLPNSYETGLLGDDAVRFLDFLAASGFSVWQMLPVQPVDAYSSPYQSYSVHAGNPDFITLPGPRHRAVKQTTGMDKPDPGTAYTRENLDEIYRQLVAESGDMEYERFRSAHSSWLDDYALYAAIKNLQNGRSWSDWPETLKYRDGTALQIFREQYRQLVEYYCLEQFVFFSQWKVLRKRAAERGVLLVGDMPIFPGHDSADVWTHRNYFRLDADGQPITVAGVPPDYFSVTGQRWGNPVYNWATMATDKFKWWVDRVRTQLELFDMIRIDHFRGLEATWEIPAGCDTAENGSWVTVPGRDLLEVLYTKFNPLPMIAEDLGVISPAVTRLRQDFQLPGMLVLQFAFDSDASNPYLPHNHKPDCLVYTGTHDNNTIKGWFNALDQKQRAKIQDYFGQGDITMPWPIICMALESVCHVAMIPMQDLLELDTEHRMNIPGTLAGNWQWQFEWDWLQESLAPRLKHLNQLYGRCGTDIS